MFVAIAQRPSQFRRIGLGPPSVQFGEIQTTVDQYFHAAGPAGFPGSARGVDPQIYPLDKLLGDQHVVVRDEDQSTRQIRVLMEKLRPLLNHGLAGAILGMGLARNNELHGVVRVAQESVEPVRIAQQQIGAFVGCETTCKTHGQRVGIKRDLCPFAGVSRSMGSRQLLLQPIPLYLPDNERLKTSVGDYKVSFAFKNGVFTENTSLVLKHFMVSPEAFPALRKITALALESDHQALVLEKSA